MGFLGWLFAVGCCFVAVESANILAIFPSNTHSHYVMYGSLMREMAKRGHQVTVVSHFPAKSPIKNMIDISLEGTLPAFTNNISIDIPLAMTPLENSFDMISDTYESCKVGLNHPEVLKMINTKQKFDVFITEIFGSECYLAISHKLGVPSVGIVSSVMLPWVNDMVSNPDNPAYVPLYFLPLTQWMNFYERMYNALMNVFIKVSYEILSNWEAQKIAENAVGPIPPIANLAKNFSIILTNSHFSINQVRPLVPQIVEVGGLHIKKIGKLPEDIEMFLNESPQGVIYFSFGSMLRVESIPQEKLQQIINALGRLKQRVLWKVNSTNLPDLPNNIRTGLWMPQVEILCHPATKLFISHGGLLGSQESIHCGVPILGVPLFADQALNLGELKKRGVAEVINYYDFNEVNIYTTVNQIINDTSYAENMDLLSRLFKDRPQHPMDTAIYWLEYVIKYKGAKHLRSAAQDLALYQYLLLDVVSFLIMMCFGVYIMIKIIFKITLMQKLKSDEEQEKYDIQSVNNNNNNNDIQNEKTLLNSAKESKEYFVKQYQNGYIQSNQNGSIIFNESLLCNDYHTKTD